MDGDGRQSEAGAGPRAQRSRGGARRDRPRRRRRSGALIALAASLALEARAESGASPEAEEDARILAENSVAAARASLAAEGDFDPFAFFVAPDGSVQRLTPKRGVAPAAPQAMLGLLQEELRRRAAAGECRAVALVADVRIALPDGGETDAFQVTIEHRSGHCQTFFQPFERAEDGLRFGGPIARRRPGAVFPECAPE
jgi:hypothetical protein